VEVRFQDQQGRTVREKGLVEDVSAAGLCVSLSLPAPVGDTVEIITDGFQGRAEVRYCDLGEYSYLIGVEFCDAQEWNRHHCLLALPEDEEAKKGEKGS
jgi:hypothetical protein